MKNSLSFRVNLIAVTIITIILTIFGFYNYASTSTSLNEKMDGDIDYLASTLQETLPVSIWNFESDQVQRTLNSAIQNSNIVGIFITEPNKDAIGFTRNVDGTISEVTLPVDQLPKGLSFELNYMEDGNANLIGSLLLMKNLRSIQSQEEKAVLSSFLLILVLDFAMAFSLYFIISRFVISPLIEVSGALEAIASGNGDLTKRIKVARKDEIGQLAGFFNQFIDTIHHSMIQVRDSSIELNETVAAVESIAQKNTSDILEAHNEVDLVATAITEMNATASDVSSSATEVANAANTSDTETNNTLVVITNTSSAIQALAIDINTSAEVMSSLENEVKNIITVLETIKSIAEQTNLLALNAAIEAARAGEHGRGFAVVADEVRALAGRTQESTEEIQHMIERLESGSSKAVGMMSKSSTQVETTVASSNDALSSLREIGNSIASINQMSGQIAVAVDEQRNVTESVNINILNIVSAIQSTSESAKEMSQEANRVSKNSEALSSLVGRFIL